MLESQIPFLCTHLTPNTPYDWNYTTLPNLDFAEEPFHTQEVTSLGVAAPSVSACYTPWIITLISYPFYLDFLVYMRGGPEDYDRYAEFTGDDGWSWKKMQKYFRKNEKFGPPADHHNTTGQFDPAVHSFDGILGVSLAGFPTPIDGRVIETADQLGGKFKFNLDYSSGYQLGTGQ